MPSVAVTISRFTDQNFPGWVEFLLVDAHGRTWKFEEKVPVITTEDLWTDSEYPRQGSIACTVLSRSVDASGRMVVTIDTSRPWGIECTDGSTVFDVCVEQIDGDDQGN